MICFIDILILMANTYGFLFYSDSKMDIEQNICVVCNVYIVKNKDHIPSSVVLFCIKVVAV